jgi:hypothetical protein
MKRLLILFLLFALPVISTQQTIVVSVQNPSFEPTSTLPGYPADPCGVRGSTISGWQFSSGSGVFQPTNPNSCGIALPPDGVTVAYAGNGGTFSQDLGISPSMVQKPSPGWQYVTEGTYVLKFSVANYFPSYPGYYAAKVSFGTQELCETSGWGTQAFTQITLVCPAPGYLVIDQALPDGGPVQGFSNLAITFSAPYWTVLFDKVSLEFTPD